MSCAETAPAEIRRVSKPDPGLPPRGRDATGPHGRSAGSAPRTVLVYGLGRSGLAAARLLRNQGHEVEVFERRPAGPDIEEVLALGAVRLNHVTASRADVCVAAPGVPIHHPDLVALRERGVEVIGEVEWVARTVPGRYVGITGTAGKGSTTRWLTDTLLAAGVDALAGGNIDPALAAVARQGATHVVEMSSFQLERCPSFRPDVAIVLNLGEDHIDRHGSVASYHAAKRNLVRNLRASDTFVFNADDPTVAAWAEESPARTRGFSLRCLPAAAATLDPAAGRIVLDAAPLLPAADLRVIGDHQVANALAVALAADALGVGRDAIACGLRAFQGLPGRYAAAGRVGDVRFIEDSIATRPLSVAAALRATAAPMVWIAGGQAKGASLAELLRLVGERVDLLVGIGESGPEFVATFGSVTRTSLCVEREGRASLRCAVERAIGHLQTHHGGHGQVLLAPLAASFDQFRDYAERARVFREVVAALPSYLAPHDGAKDAEGRWTRSS